MWGMHASIIRLIFMGVEFLVLQIMYRLLPLRKFGEESVLGKVVIITGAGTGLGKYVAHEMVKRGAKVVMGTYINIYS